MAGLDAAYTVALWPLRTRNFQAHAAKLQTLVEAVAATARPIRGRSRHLQHYPAPDIHPGPFKHYGRRRLPQRSLRCWGSVGTLDRGARTIFAALGLQAD